jgi:subtilisin
MSAALAALLLIGAVPGATIGAPAPERGRGAGELVRVIVNFGGRPGAPGVARIRELGGLVHHRYQLINSVAASVPAPGLAALRASPRVRSVELDGQLVAFDHGPATGDAELEAAWGVEHIGAGQVHAAGVTGAGVKVGVIDTGIDYSHPDLDGAYAGGWDFYNNDADPRDDHGHGTHVAGTIAAEANGQGVVGVAPEARLYAYKVLGADGSGDYSHLIAALERAALVDGVDVVNMSLGGSVASDALAAAVAAAYARGVTLVAAAGNVNPFDLFQLLYGCPVAYPAAYPEVMATTFTGQLDQLTGYSCTGPQVDFASPGDLINSTVPTGSCSLCAPSGYRGDLSGTSMASPHLAGTVALVLSHGIANAGDPGTLADDVKAHLCATAGLGFGVLTTPITPTDPRYAQYFGCGMTDANNALLTSPPPTGGGEPPANQPPLALADSISTPQDTPVTVGVLANDSDPDGDTLTVSALTQPLHGTAALGGGGVRYTPAAGYVGADSFDYAVSDGNGGSATATVSVSVTAPSGPTQHVADLDALPTLQAKRWTARVRIRVHNGQHGNLAGVVVTGVFSTGAVRSCTTGTNGLCTVSRTKLLKSLASVTFTVTSLAKAGRTYVPSANHDPDGDSDGTTIVVRRP